MQAYEHKCAVCGFNVRVGNTLVAPEAAHIKWHQAGGPDVEENGIALCALHHKLFDRGAFTVSPELKIQVSDRAHGTHGFKEWLSVYHGEYLKEPQRPDYYPQPRFVQWHIREVFQGETRYGVILEFDDGFRGSKNTECPWGAPTRNMGTKGSASVRECDGRRPTGLIHENYYQENYEAYHEQTFSIDPVSFLSPLVRCLPPGGTCGG